jgi:eukaryotic-like serine/threonine-protein kinase
MTEQVLGRYHVLERLGQGGMGVVYRAYDPALRCERAIKVLPDDAVADVEARARLLREARAASRLLHPGICTVFDVGEDGGRAYIVMELVEGESLAARIARGPLDAHEVGRIAGEVADALAAAHAEGVVHRDLKSSNVMVTPEGHAKLLDFGIARVQATGSVATTALTQPGFVLGTPECMAPEVLQGHEADPRADVWALGVMLHEMLAGEQPFRGRTVAETQAAVLQQPPAPLPAGVPRALADVVAHCLEKDPARRFQSAAEVKAALEHPYAHRAAARPRASLRRMAALGGVALVMAAGLVLLCRPPVVRALAVMPLDNLSGDASQQYLADGMTDELITTLSQISALRVTSRSSVMAYRDKPKPVTTVARELHVQNVIEGSVMRAGDEIRVTARLIGAAADQPLWAQSYVRPFHDVLVLQNELAHAIADQVRIRLTASERRRLARRRAVDPEVYGLCLRGRLAWNQLTEQGMRESTRLYEQAIARDSTYAPAWAGLSDTYWALANWYESPAFAMPRAMAAARRAIALDESLADGHAALGAVLMDYAWDWDGAERELRRAIELEPSHAVAHRQLAFLMRYRGRFEQDEAEVRASVQLDPLTPFTVAQQGWPELFSRHYVEAVGKFEASIVADPDAAPSHQGLGIALLQLHEYPRAIAEFEQAATLAPVMEARAGLAHALVVGGQPGGARALLDTLEHHSPGIYVGPTSLALVYAALGERSHALDLLEQGYRAHDGWTLFIKVDPRFDPLRSEPRFQTVLEKVGL